VTVVGLLHPGEMGAAIGAALQTRGETVLWACLLYTSDAADE